MSTGSLGSGQGKRGVVLYDCGNTHKNFINADTVALEAGTELTLIGAKNVRKRAAGEPFVGIVYIGAEVGEQVVVSVTYQNIIRAASSVAITAGSNIVPNGTVLADGRPQYIAGVAGNVSHAVALTATGGTADEELFIGINSFPVVLP